MLTPCNPLVNLSIPKRDTARSTQNHLCLCQRKKIPESNQASHSTTLTEIWGKGKYVNELSDEEASQNQMPDQSTGTNNLISSTTKEHEE